MPGARPFMPFFSGIFATPLPFNRLSSRQFSAPSLPTRLAPAAALAAILAFASAPATAARTGEHRRRGRASDRRGGEYLHLAESRSARESAARRAARLADGGVFRPVLQEPARPRRFGSGAAAREFARLRLHHRCFGPGRHQ